MHVSSPTLVRLGQSLTSRVLEPALGVTYLDVPIVDLPADLDGFTLAQISDLHFGRDVWSPVHLDRALDVICEARPDLIVNTGDYMYKWPPVERFEPAIRALADLGIPRVSILGNHDWYGGPDPACALTRVLRSAGETVLFNESWTCRRGDAEITFVGLSADGPDEELNRGIDNLLAAPRPRIVLIHEPDLILRLPVASADLVLAGHTHAGQIALPGLRPWTVRHFCGSNFVEGRYDTNGNRMYVNRGLGCVGFPLRFRASPEVTMVRLRPALR